MHFTAVWTSVFDSCDVIIKLKSALKSRDNCQSRDNCPKLASDRSVFRKLLLNKMSMSLVSKSCDIQYGWYAHPIVYGDYPDIMKERIEARSLQQGFAQSRLPAFTEEEKEEIKGTYDYLTINMYTTVLGQAIEDVDINEVSVYSDISVYTYQPDDWEKTVSDWFKVVPWGARHLVTWIRDTYGDDKGIIVTENGYHDSGNELDDLETRGRYHKLYLSNLNDAMYKDGVNLTGYMAWSLLNDVEWYAGWLVNLGHYHVDFDSEEKTRTAKASAGYYKQVVTTNCLVDSCEPSPRDTL